ncbi:MAG TPA: adenine deaminase C-terminal domain-containing protein, partial [Acidobacteriota bacterium]|nr:adenine deaminase C-terminal domain-containing protein [Acidobacteriota bacterium]
SVQAIQSVTLNPAVYSGLDQDIGGIAPGRFADVVLLDDLEQCRAQAVLIAGKIVTWQGESAITAAPPLLLPEFMHALRLGLAITPEVFRIPAPSAMPKVRVMELVNLTITAERLIDLNASSGCVEASLDDDLLKIAMFDRHQRSTTPAFGFLKGLGAKVGAIGLTANLDENTLMVVGSDDHDMALCANALLQAGGGMAIVENGKVLEKLEFPVGGIFSLLPWRDVGKGLRRIQNRLKEMGSPFDKPIFALNFLPFVTLPALRITARGLINAKERKIVSLFAE